MQEVLWNQYQLLDSVLPDYSSVGVGRNDGARGGEMNPVFFRKEKFDMVRNITFWLIRFFRCGQVRRDGVHLYPGLLHGWSLSTRVVTNIFSISIHILHMILILQD